MHVTRVELENIKSYGEGERRGDFRFERGTTAIVGPNGAGKTTILEAVAWALFDVLDYSKEDFLRRGAKRGSVRVTFKSDLDERLYTVYRDTGAGYYVYDPELRMKLQQGKADVRKWLDQHLGVEPGTDLRALFRSAIGVPQGLFTTDFLRSPAERKAAFDRLLKVEEYRESADRLRDTVNLINERAAETRGRITGAEAQLARYDATVAEHKSASERAEELSDGLNGFQREAEAHARAVAELDEAERRVVETAREADRLGVERESAERRLRDLQSDLEAARLAAERQRATEADYRTYNEADETLRVLETEREERDRLGVEARDVERMLVTAESDVRRLDDALERARSARSSLAEMEKDLAAQEELERERERLRDLLAQARAAAERLPELEERERELTQAAAALRASINQDERASAKAKGGVCPILHEPCKNLAEEGRTFEDFFGEQLKTNRSRLATVERDAVKVSRDVRAARDAEKAAARSETTRARLAHERELLAEREAALARVDSELAGYADASEESRGEVPAEMIGSDGK